MIAPSASWALLTRAAASTPFLRHRLQLRFPQQGGAPQLCAVIGPNGIGKSVLREAFSFVLGAPAALLRCKCLSELRSRGSAASVPCSVAATFHSAKGGEVVACRTVHGRSSTFHLGGSPVSKSSYLSCLAELGADLRQHSRLVVQQHKVAELAGSADLLPMIDKSIGTSALKEERERLEEVAASAAAEVSDMEQVQLPSAARALEAAILDQQLKEGLDSIAQSAAKCRILPLHSGRIEDVELAAVQAIQTQQDAVAKAEVAAASTNLASRTARSNSKAAAAKCRQLESLLEQRAASLREAQAAKRAAAKQLSQSKAATDAAQVRLQAAQTALLHFSAAKKVQGDAEPGHRKSAAESLRAAELELQCQRLQEQVALYREELDMAEKRLGIESAKAKDCEREVRKSSYHVERLQSSLPSEGLSQAPSERHGAGTAATSPQNDSFFQAVARCKEAHPGEVLGTLAQCGIEVLDERYSLALEVALGRLLHTSVVVSTREVAMEALSIFEEVQCGPITCIILDELPSAPRQSQTSLAAGRLVPASQLVQADTQPLRNLVHNILGRWDVAQDASVALALRKTGRHVVCLDGTVAKASGELLGGARPRTVKRSHMKVFSLPVVGAGGERVCRASAAQEYSTVHEPTGATGDTLQSAKARLEAHLSNLAQAKRAVLEARRRTASQRRRLQAAEQQKHLADEELRSFEREAFRVSTSIPDHARQEKLARDAVLGAETAVYDARASAEKCQERVERTQAAVDVRSSELASVKSAMADAQAEAQICEEVADKAHAECERQRKALLTLRRDLTRMERQLERVKALVEQLSRAKSVAQEAFTAAWEGCGHTQVLVRQLLDEVQMLGSQCPKLGALEDFAAHLQSSAWLCKAPLHCAFTPASQAETEEDTRHSSIEAAQRTLERQVKVVERAISAARALRLHTSEVASKVTSLLKSAAMACLHERVPKWLSLMKVRSDAEAEAAALADTRFAKLQDALHALQDQCQAMFSRLSPRGRCSLLFGLTPSQLYEKGVTLECAPSGRQWRTQAELSGGQRALLALALLLALQSLAPAPFFVLDEVDAALDPLRARRAAAALHALARGPKQAQARAAAIPWYIVISHRSSMHCAAPLLLGLYHLHGSVAATMSSVPGAGPDAGVEGSLATDALVLRESSAGKASKATQHALPTGGDSSDSDEDVVFPCRASSC